MRRTVKASLAPLPRQPMTMPSKIWIRSRVPSTTLACTFTVSPGIKVGTFLRWDSASSRLMTLDTAYKDITRTRRDPTGGRPGQGGDDASARPPGRGASARFPHDDPSEAPREPDALRTPPAGCSAGIQGDAGRRIRLWAILRIPAPRRPAG